MKARFPSPVLVLALLAGLTPVAADSAPVPADRPATAAVDIATPSTLQKLQDLNFANLGVTTAGTATVNPNTDALTTTGGVIFVGGVPYAARFRGVAPKKSVVIIRIPKNPITITRIGGTETMTVSNWTMSGQDKRNVAAKQEFDFQVGATLAVNANQAEGTYVGTFTVEVQYP